MVQRRTFSATIAGIALTTLMVAGCSQDATSEPSNGSETSAATEPVTITMWTRSVTAAQTEALVERFNQENTDEITVELTVVPFQEYLQKVSASASGGDLPDLVGANVIDGPNYSQLGLWTDISDRIDSLESADSLAAAHLQAASFDGSTFAVPHVLDASALFYNKVLFEQAGLDPEDPPTTLEEVHEYARAIDAISDDVGGLYFPGDCGGCLAFTVFPSIWAAGGTIMNDDGTVGTLDSQASNDTFSIYNDMWNDGSMIAESRNENGATQNEAFASGTAGFALLGSKALGTIAENENLKIGVTPIPGPGGGTSTFVGGDVVGIASSSKNPDAAWKFIEWTLSEQIQMEEYAAKGFMPVRADLAENEFSAQDERVLLFNTLVSEGNTPYSVRFFQTFNDPQGPWLSLVRGAVFDEGPAGLLASNEQVTSSLQDS